MKNRISIPLPTGSKQRGKADKGQTFYPLLFLMLMLLCLTQQSIGQFTPGNLVVFRATNSAALANTGTAIVIDEYNTTTASQSSPVSTATLPTTAPNRIVVSGTASASGQISRSENGRYLLVPGYDAALLDANTTFNTNSVVRTVNGSGNVGAGISGANYSSGNNNLRGATSDDGTNFWMTGNGLGIRHATSAAPTTVTTVSSTSTNNRACYIFNGQLYLTTGAGTQGIYSVGTGKPTAASTTATRLFAPTNTDVYGFAISPDALTIYYVAASTGGIYRSVYTSSWSAGTLITSGFTSGTSIAVDWTNYTFNSTAANGAIIYATNPTTLIKGADNGTSTMTLTTLRTISGNNAFRGLAFAPSYASLDNTGTPAVANVTQGALNKALFGFRITPEGNITFSSVTISFAGTATNSDISNLRIAIDNNDDGIYNGGDAVISGTGLNLAGTVTFSSLTGSAFSTAKRYLLIGDVNGSATLGRTLTASISAATDYTTNAALSTGTAAGNEQTIIAATTPELTVNNQSELTTLSTVEGSFSTNGTLEVSGSNLDGTDVVLTAPAGFEISTNPTSGFGGTITFTEGTAPYTTGTLSATTIYVRISASATAGALSGDVEITGGAATQVDEPVSGTVLAAQPLTQASDVTFFGVNATFMDIEWTPGNGSNRIVVVRPTSTSSEFTPTDGQGYTADLNITLSGTTGANNYVVYNGNGSGPITVTGLSGCTDYTVKVYEYNGSGATANYITSNATNNPNTQTTLPVSIANVTSLSAVPNGNSGEINVSWTNPSGCYDEVMVIISPAANTGGAPSGDGTGYNASLTYTSGDVYGNGYVAYKGTASPQIISSLTNGYTNYRVKVFTRSGTNWSTGVEVTATAPFTIVSCTEVIVPQFIQGNSGTNTNRVPYAFRVTLSGLSANATYRYFNQVVDGTDVISSNGAGNPIYTGTSWVRSTGPGLASSYGEFTTNGLGSYTGWFIIETTGNARFLAGNTVSMRIILNDGAGGTSIVGRATTSSTITVANLGTGATNATGIRSTSSAQSKDFVCLYDNTIGSGRPLSATFVESDGTANTTGNSYATFYGTSVNTVAGAWGAIMPNTNANGVQRIESRSYTDGSILCFSTNGSGFTGTVNPAGGTTEVVITGVPLDCGYITLDQTNISQTTAGNIAASTNDNILSNFRINASNAANALDALSFTIGGTFIAGDVTNFNLYTSTTNTFPGGSPLKTISATLLANGAILNFDALAHSLTIGNHYFWIAADLSAAGASRTIVVPVLANGDFNFTTTPYSITNNITIGGTKTIVAAVPTISLANGTISSGNILQSSTNNVLYRADVTVATVAAQLNQVSFTTAGTYAAADLSNLQLWYSSNPTFSTGTATSIATKTSGLGAGTHTFSSLTQNFAVGTNYLYVTSNLNCATLANTIYVNAISTGDFSFASGTPAGSGFTDGGTMTVTEATPANVTGSSATAGNTTASLSWTNPSCFSEIMIVAKATAFTAAVPTGNGSLYTNNSNNFTDALNTAFDGGVVVYKGSGSPQSISGLTNGTTYNFKIFSRNGSSWSNGVVVNATPILTINPGDIQIVGMNTAAPDGFTWVTWVTIPAGTQIKFTDGAFLSSAGANTANNFRGGENYVTWSHTSDITPGTVIRMVNTSGSITTVTGGGTATGALNGLSGSGDQIFAFLGADPTAPGTNPTTFNGTIVYGVTIGAGATSGGAWLNTGTASANTSYLPSELNTANANVAFTTSNANTQYTAARNSETTLAAYKPMVTNTSNWTFSGSNLTLNETDFTLFSPDLTISEIMYDSPGNDEEWIELYNGSGSNIDLLNYQITNTTPAWSFTFPSSFVIVPGQYITVQVGTNAAFPFTPDVVAYTTSNNLSNTGSTISLVNPSSVTIDDVTYSNTVLTAAAGNGATLEVTDVSQQNSNFPTNWQSSAVLDGSPSAINSTGISIVYSRGNGSAYSDAIWAATTSGTPQTIASLGGFASNRDIVIQTGHTVQFASNANVKNLTVQSGATLWRNSSVSNQMIYLSIYGTTVQLNGTVGNGNTFDAIGLNIEGANVALQGTGTVNLGRIRKSNNTNTITNLIIDKNLNLLFPGTALYNNTGSAATFNVTVNSGRVVDFKGASHLSLDGVDGRNSSTRYGTFTINGTLNNIDTLFVLTDNNNSGTTAITIANGGTISANTVMVALAPNATLYYTGNGGPVTSNFQFTINGTLNVYKSLELQSGTFAPVGIVRLKSTSINSAAILNDFTSGFAGTYSGQITAERFYGSSLTNNQHFMSSPVNAPLFSQFGASGTEGYIIPTNDCDETKSASNTPYGTVFSYNESNGAGCGFKQWRVEKTGSTTNARGYSILKGGSGTLSITGTPNLDASYTLAGLTNTGWATHNTKQNRPLGSGWHLMGNPYAAPIQISTTPTGFDAQIMVWHTSGPNANSYQAATVIAPFQAFMVHKSTPGGSDDYTINGSDRVVTPTTFYRLANDNEIKVTAENVANGLLDYTTVAFNQNATNRFDPPYDFNKLAGALGRHTLYTLNNGDWMSVNVLKSMEENNSVKVNFDPGVSGQFKFSFDGLNSFDPTSYITLEDKKLNVWHDVRKGTYNFTSTASDDWNRFVLHFTPATKIQVADVTCNGTGMIQLQQPGNTTWNFTLADQNQNTLATGVLNENSPVIVEATAGVYTLTLVDAFGYTVIKNIQVEGAQPLSITALEVSDANPSEGDEITFTALVEGAGTYEWNFGDGVTVATSSATHTYQQEGIYQVMLNVTNSSGCSAQATRTVTVTNGSVTGIQENGKPSNVTIWNSADELFVNFRDQKDANTQITIYNMLGQIIHHEKIGSATTYRHQFNQMTTGYVLVRVTTGNSTYSKKIFLTGNQ